MLPPPPRSTRPYTLFPYTTLFRSRFLQRCGLLFRAARQIFSSGTDFVGARVDAVGRFRNRKHDLAQLRYRFVIIGAQLFKSRWERRFNPVIDLPLRHPLQAIAQSSYNGLLSLFPRSSLILVSCCIPARHRRPTTPAAATFLLRPADPHAGVPQLGTT